MHQKLETKLLYFVWIFYHFLTNNLLFDFRQIPMTITLKFIRRLPTSNLIKKGPLLGMLNTCCNIHQMCTDRARESIDISLYYGRIHLQLDRLKIFSPWSHNQVFNWQDKERASFLFLHPSERRVRGPITYFDIYISTCLYQESSDVISQSFSEIRSFYSLHNYVM